MGLFGNQFANVIEWTEYRDDVIFWKWANREITASRLCTAQRSARAGNENVSSIKFDQEMIARILIPVVVFTLLPYLWIYKRYGKLRLKSLWQRVLFWLPALVVIAYSAYITMLPNFLPRNPVLVGI